MIFSRSKKQATLKLRQNALRQIFEVGMPHYTNVIESNACALAESQPKTYDKLASAFNRANLDGWDSSHLGIGVDLFDTFLWSYYKNGNGGLFSAEKKSLPFLFTENQIGISIYPMIIEDNIFLEASPIVSIEGEYHSDALHLDETNILKSVYEKQESNGTLNAQIYHEKTKNVNTSGTEQSILRTLLLAHKCYQQIRKGEDINSTESIQWAENIENPVAEFDAKFPGLRL